MPPSIMPSTLPAIVSPRVGTPSPDPGASYNDDRGFALSGLSAASAALRGALFEATGRNSPGSGLGSGSGLASSAATSRPMSAATIALLMNPGPGGPPHPPLPSASRGTPGAILGYLGAGGGPVQGAGVGAGGPGSGPSGSAGVAGGGGGPVGAGSSAQDAVHSAAALRAAADALLESVEAAVRAREAQTRTMLTATRDNLAPSSGTRLASARALDRALTASSRRPAPGLPGSSASSTDERLAWVRGLVRRTEGGQAYAAAAEERERERAGGGGGGAGSGEAGDPGPGLIRRGSLPALRPSRREDVLALQTWLTDMLNMVVSEAAAVRQTAPAGAPPPPIPEPGAPPPAAAAAAPPAASEPGIQAQHATEVADAALYVVRVAMEELRRQVATECKERGELLGLLSEQQAGLVALRGALAAEARAAEASAQWAGLLAERERVAAAAAAAAAGVAAWGSSGERAVGEAGDAASSSTAAAAAAAPSAAAAAAASSLAAQLVTAQAAVATAERRFSLADAALAGEVARRAAAEQQLEATRELLRRQEHEWLHHRAVNQRLEGEVQTLRDKLESASRTAAVAEATVEAAREQTRIGRDDVSQLEASLARMRQQYEGNEILVAAQRQQIRELETALAALREQHREQAVALGKVGKVTEQYEETAANLRADLSAETARAVSLTMDLATRTARLTEVEERLAGSDAELAKVRSQLAATEATAAKAAAEAEAALRGLRSDLADAQAARRAEETRRVEVEKETTALTELSKMLGRTLQLQGVEGVPGVTDRTWETTGPLGASQRVLGLATQQVALLFGSKEDLARQMRALQAKITEEKETNAKLQRDLYDARTIETRMLREKDIADMRLSTLEHDLRVSQSDAIKSRASLQDSEVRVKVQHETIVQLQAQAKELTPLKKRVDALTSDLDINRRLEEEARAALAITRQGLEQAEEQSRFYQGEMQRLQDEVAGLKDEIKELRRVSVQLAEKESANMELEKQIIALKRQLDVTAESHTETLRQLELAKFFLQGLDGNSPNSPARSSISNCSPSRERAVAAGWGQSPHSRTPSRTLTMTQNASQSGRFGSPPGRFGVRPSGMHPQGMAGSGDVSLNGGAGDTPASVDDSDGGDGASRAISPVTGRRSAVPPMRGRATNTADGTRPASAVTITEDEDVDGEGEEAEALGGRSHGSRAASAAFSGARASAQRSRPTSRLGSAGVLLSRPMSGVMGLPEEDDYSTEVPTVVLDLIENRGLTKRIQRSNNKWSSIKIGIMAWFSKRLRQRLLVVSEQLAEKDLEIAQLHYNYMSEMRQREEYIATELLPTLIPVLQSALKDSQREVQQLRAEIPLARRDLDALAGGCAVLGFSLQGYRDRRTHAVSRNCQTDSEAADDWARFATNLPPLPPRLVLSLGSLVDAIVRIYVRAAATVEEVPTWGVTRHDTIQDAIMAHYTSQRAPGTFTADLIREPDSPIARLLTSAQMQAKNTKVGMFLYFLNLSPEGVHWPSPSWHFLLHLLHCLRVLLSGTWRIMTRRWATTEGVQIPMPAVLDLVGNLFNVQAPGELDGAISVRLAAIVTPGSAGPAVDLDALLLLLVREHNAGNCPRAPLLFPRRITDGQLFNIFNTAGHNAHVDALRSPAVAQYIGPHNGPPGSPQVNSKRLSAVITQSSGAALGGPKSFGNSLLVAGPPADILHPYGDLGEPRSSGNSFGGPGVAAAIAAAAAAAAAGGAFLDPQSQEEELYGSPPEPPPGPLRGPQQESSLEEVWHGNQRLRQRQEEERQRQLQRRAQAMGLGLAPEEGSGVEGAGSGSMGEAAAPYGPKGSMTVSFEISHAQHSSTTTMNGEAGLARQASGVDLGGGGVGGAGGGVSGGGRVTTLPPAVRPKRY